MKQGYLAFIPALVASTASFAAEPAVQTPAMDMRCFLVATAAQQTLTDPNLQQVATLSALFYLGRISSQMTDAEMETAAFTETKALKTANGEKMQAVFTQCGAFMGSKGAALQTLGERLAEAERREAQAKK